MIKSVRRIREKLNRMMNCVTLGDERCTDMNECRNCEYNLSPEEEKELMNSILEMFGDQLNESTVEWIKTYNTSGTRGSDLFFKLYNEMNVLTSHVQIEDMAFNEISKLVVCLESKLDSSCNYECDDCSYRTWTLYGSGDDKVENYTRIIRMIWAAMYIIGEKDAEIDKYIDCLRKRSIMSECGVVECGQRSSSTDNEYLVEYLSDVRDKLKEIIDEDTEKDGYKIEDIEYDFPEKLDQIPSYAELRGLKKGETDMEKKNEEIAEDVLKMDLPFKQEEETKKEVEKRDDTLEMFNRLCGANPTGPYPTYSPGPVYPYNAGPVPYFNPGIGPTPIPPYVNPASVPGFAKPDPENIRALEEIRYHVKKLMKKTINQNGKHGIKTGIMMEILGKETELLDYIDKLIEKTEEFNKKNGN